MLPIPEFARDSRRLYAALVPAAVVAFADLALHENNEFIGGWLTKPIFDLHDLGTHLLLIALAICGWLPRIAAGLSIFGAIICVPMYSWSVMPGLYNLAYPGNYPITGQPFLVFDPIGLVGLFSAIVAVRCASSIVSVRR